jgi:arylsulfatase A-like enzyme
MKTRTFLLALAALGTPGISPWIAPAATAADAKKPNVLVIVADDLGYGELGIQGNPQIPTPNIDSIGKNGARFTSGYVSGPYCSPTRAGLLTGKYQQRFGHEFNPGPAQNTGEDVGLSLQEKTLGDRFKAAGYSTGWFGKSHLGNKPDFHPLKRGFDEFYGFLGGAHDYLDPKADTQNPILRGTEPVTTAEYTTEAFAREAVGFIEKHKADPWLVYLPFNAVHNPLQAPEKYLARFNDVQDPKRKAFSALLSALDDAVGSVLGKVRELGVEENTLVFFISDNGGPTRQTTSSNGPLRGFKAQTWEGGVRVPWLVQWKGKIPAGQTLDQPVIQLDILPTALAAVGAPASADWKLDGVNLLPLLTGTSKDAPHDALYWRFGQQIAIRKGDWKLVKAPDDGTPLPAQGGKASTEGAALYNLAKDIGESTDLASQEPEKVKELAAAWDAWNAQLVEPKWRPAGGGKGRQQGQGQGGGARRKAAAAAAAPAAQ